jgi:hypothetical protein
MLWRDASSPGSKVYPVLDSKKEAEDFVRAAYVRGTGDTDVGSPALLETLNTIRRVKRDERDTARAKRMVRPQGLSDDVGGALEREQVVYSPTFAVNEFSEVRTLHSPGPTPMGVPVRRLRLSTVAGPGRVRYWTGAPYPFNFLEAAFSEGPAMM